MDTPEAGLAGIRAWVVSRRPDAGPVELDTDLIDSRLIDSLDFAELLFMIEEACGRTLDLELLEPEDLRTLRRIGRLLQVTEAVHG